VVAGTSNRLEGQASEALVLNGDLIREISERLLLGIDPQKLIHSISSRGISVNLIQAEVDRVQKNPYFKVAKRLQDRLNKRDWVLRSRARLEKMAISDNAVLTETELGADEFFSRYYYQNRPVLLKGLIDHWPALRLWSLEYFASKFATTEIDVQWNRNSDSDYERRSNEFAQTRKLSEVIERMKDQVPTNDFYVTANNSGRNKIALAALWQDIGDIEGYLISKEVNDGFFWMGPKGTVTPYHHDLTNNFLVQISGRKRVKLVSSLEIASMRNHQHCFSEWSGDELSLNPLGVQRPLVRECVLGPGDVLFLPVGWWHHVEALDATIGMSFINFNAENDFFSDYTTYGKF
jgi:hypothetical protein